MYSTILHETAGTDENWVCVDVGIALRHLGVVGRPARLVTVRREAGVRGEADPRSVPGVIVAVQRAGVIPWDQGADLLIVINISLLLDPKPGSIVSMRC